MQREDPELGQVWEIWVKHGPPSKTISTPTSDKPEVKAWLLQWSKMEERNGVLGRVYNDSVEGEVFQILLPKDLHRQILVGCHDEWGHQGKNRTYQLAKSRVFWPGMMPEIASYVKECERCAKAKVEQPQVRTPMRHLLAFNPLEIVAIDFVKLDKGKGGYEDVLVMTDVYTKLAQAVPCRDQRAVTVAEVLRDHWFTKYGIPNRLHSDQGANFEGQVIKELCKLYGVYKTHTTPYHPQGNAQAERFNRTLFGLIKSLDERDRRRWPELLPHLVYVYNTTPHATTGVTPFSLMFGRKERIPLDQLFGKNDTDWEQDYVQKQADMFERAREVVSERMQRIAAKNKERVDVKLSKNTIHPDVGSIVYLKKCAFTQRHKLQNKYFDEMYVVVWHNSEKDVYHVRPVKGGPLKVVNRKLLKVKFPIETGCDEHYEELNYDHDVSNVR